MSARAQLNRVRPRALAAVLARPVGDPLAQDGLGVGLRGRSARGAASTLAGQWVRFVLQLGSTVVLARLVSPVQYGLAGMALAVVGIGDALTNVGLSQATVQRKDITQAHVSLFFWLQVGLGLLLSAVTALCAGPIASFYGRSQLVPITLALAPMFLLGALSAQHQAVLSRQMRFGALALIDVLGLAVGVVASIAVAAAGGGAWALVVLTLSVPVCRVILSWYASGWMPGGPARAPGAGTMVRFGLNLTLSNVLDYSAQNIDNVLIGRFYGAGPLGLYSRAYGLILLPIRQVSAPLARVAVPVLSYLVDQPARYRRFFAAALSAIAYASLPLIAGTAALSNQVVGLMLGPRWLPAAPIFQVLAIGGVLTTLRCANGWLFVSTGHTGRQALWALANRPVIIGGIVAGLPYGVTGVAWGFAIAHLVLFVPSFVISIWGTPVTMRDVVQAIWRPALLGAGVFVVAHEITLSVHTSDVLVVLTAVGVCAALTAVLVAAWPGMRTDLRELREAFGSTRRGRPPSAPLDRSGGPQGLQGTADVLDDVVDGHPVGESERGRDLHHARPTVGQ